MNFLSPAFLIGLPLLAVPLVIHLLSKRQQKRISWGAMRFLMQAATRKRRLWRLTDLLLLLLRTAAFLFFIGALARPLIPANWLGGSAPREVILVLDQSMSMSRRIGDGTVFDVAIGKAQEMLGELKGSDSVRVMLARESPQWLTPQALPATPANVRRLRAQINDLKPTLSAANVAGCVHEAADLETPKEKSARVIAVISDRQRFGWRMDEKPLWAVVQARIQQAAIPTTVRVQLVGPEQPAANISVTKIDTARQFGAVDQPLTFSAVVQNHSPTPSAATLLNWRINNESAGAMTVPELAAGASTTISLAHQFGTAGTFEVTCEIDAADDLKADNAAHLLVTVYDRLPILVVEDAASSDPLESDATWVLAALGARKSADDKIAWRSVFDPTVVDSKTLGSTDLNRYRCVVIVNAGRVAPEALSKLESYAHDGGGVWIATGARTDEKYFNEQLYRGGVGMAPLKVKGAIGDANDREKFFSVRAASESHPATALLADFQKLDLDRARVYRRQQFDALSAKDVSVLLQAGDGEPVVVERKFGRGRVLVQAVPLGISWSTLPLCQAYVAMLHEWLWYLSEPGLPKRNVAAGEMLVADAAKDSSSAELTLPDGKKVELTAAMTGGAAEHGRKVAQFRYMPMLPGEYVMTPKDSGAAGATRFHVLRNPLESDLTTFGEADRQLFASLKEFQFDTGLNAAAAGGKVETPRQPLEGWLLGALALVFVGELLLAGWTTHQRNLRVKPVSMGI